MNMWEIFKWEGGFPTITAEQRAMQRRRLEGLGEEPTQEELGDMMWPQRAWWEDRDRIGECQSLLTLVLALPSVATRALCHPRSHPTRQFCCASTSGTWRTR